MSWTVRGTLLPLSAQAHANAEAALSAQSQHEAMTRLPWVSVLAAVLVSSSASAALVQPMHASWVATEGYPDESFISFSTQAYLNMRNDPRRTQVFAEAIRQRLRGREGELVVLDIGTGPEALLAIMAARAGAKKVYAVEVMPAVAAAARQAISEASDVPEGCIELFEGFSTELELPPGEKADLLVAEIVGNVASAEGIYATMHDAQQRLLRRPKDPLSYIPLVVETLCAPMSYTEHHPQIGPANFDWDAVRAHAPPPKFSTETTAVLPLAPPQRLEHMRFDEPLPPPGTELRSSLAFELCGDLMAASAASCKATLLEAPPGVELGEEAAGAVAAEVGASVSGMGLWPRLIMDEAETLVVDTRAVDGQPRKSCWELVFPLLCAAPQRVAPGGVLEVDAAVQLGTAVDDPVTYAIAARVTSMAPEPELQEQGDTGSETKTADLECVG